jgi:hypothetical protein
MIFLLYLGMNEFVIISNFALLTKKNDKPHDRNNGDERKTNNARSLPNPYQYSLDWQWLLTRC